MRDRLAQLLQRLERELRRRNRWEPRPPPVEALQSTLPFAFDTLRFDQWLQWVLLPRLNELLRRQLPLPDNCAIAPMAEEVYGDDVDMLPVIETMAEIDALLTNGEARLH